MSSFEEEEEKDACYVCQEEMFFFANYTVLPCGHKLHTLCFITSLKNKINNCGICRSVIVESTISYSLTDRETTAFQMLMEQMQHERIANINEYERVSILLETREQQVTLKEQELKLDKEILQRERRLHREQQMERRRNSDEEKKQSFFCCLIQR